MGVKVTNNGYGTISAGLASGDTTITLDSGQGARFPTLGAGDYFYATLIDTSNNLEIVKVTARSTDSMTVVRGQDNTSARAFSIGDRFELRPTAALFEDIADSATITAVSDQANSSTGYLALPSGTTAQRPGSAVVGMVRHNTDDNLVETYDGTQWVAVGDQRSSYSVEYLVVAGGGGGAGDLAGGGGAGGYIASNQVVAARSSFAIVIGAGGAGGNNARPNSGGLNGSDTTGFGNTAIGGGTSTGYRSSTSSTGTSGGSGGGGSAVDTSSYTGSAGAGTTGQGNAGGPGGYSPNYGGGGGGGANAVGDSAIGSATGANGGAGKQWLDGSYYAGGGGGGGYSAVTSTQSSGGIGGGGAGGIAAGTAVAGTANTGGGGGGGGYAGAPTAGAAGGSGIVIIRYPGFQKGFGGTVTYSGGYTYHTFTSSGTFVA